MAAEPQPGEPAPSEPWPTSSRTEERNPRTADIDLLPTGEVLRLLNAEDATVAAAVASALPELARVVDLVVERVRAGGAVHYFGAGTSGRLAVLDSAEVVPTFGWRRACSSPTTPVVTARSAPPSRTPRMTRRSAPAMPRRYRWRTWRWASVPAAGRPTWPEHCGRPARPGR